MIQSNELRIGNLFYPINRNGMVHLPDEIPFCITELSLNEVKAYLNGKPLHQVVKYDSFSIRDISPIPLTEEWLVRFGFEKTFENPFIEYEWQYGFFTMDNELNPYLGRYTNENDFKYVHQLQNLYFALTGEELKLTENDTH